MKKIKLFLVIVLIAFAWNESGACTSAIITGKLTPDGRPLLWKHRDTSEDNNRIEYFKGKNIILLHSLIVRTKEELFG